MVKRRLDVFPTTDILEFNDESIAIRFKKFSAYPSLLFLMPAGNTDFKANKAIQNALVIKWNVNPTVNAEMLKAMKLSTALDPFMCNG